jgi:two-component sensor histidine kinase
MKTEQIWENVSQNHEEEFLSSGGQMADAIRSFDWASTSIGPLGTWPQSLRSVVQMAVLSRQAICLFWGRDLNMIYNDAYMPILGAKEKQALGMPFEDIWSDVWVDIAPIVQEALSGKGTWHENMPLTMLRNGDLEETFWSFSYSPLYNDDGSVAGLINITTDTTSTVKNQAELEQSIDDAQNLIEVQKKLDAQQRVIQREMAHRIKNILSMTMAVVSQTMRHSVDMTEAAETITKRITALSNAQDVLTNSRFEDADVGTLIKEVLSPHLAEAGRIQVTGPSVVIPAQAALGMALAIHELATNATKYGALYNDTGRVSLHWSTDRNGGFLMEWHETGGPTVSAPTRTGFGSRLMSRIVPSYFAGTGESYYEPSGFRYVLSGSVQMVDEVNQ